jgi:hypothetical protein
MLEPDWSCRSHLVWLAVEEALRDETTVAGWWLDMVPDDPGEPQDRFLARLARTVIAAKADGALSRRERKARLATMLAEAEKEYPEFGAQRPYRRIHRRCARCLR